MNLIDALSHRLRSTRIRLSALLAKKWKRSFYLYLAGIFTLLIMADALFLHLATDMKQTTFDMMVRYRVVVPKPDPDIVIVDINEASLAAMAKDYGRWPWPRQVLGEFVEQIEKQRPKAIVFDILFSDPDVYNPDSDAYFDAAIAATGNTFFPMLRLDPASDTLSQIKPGMIPGVIAMSGEAQRDATVAMVLPHFKAVLEGGRIGLHNIYPDTDGIARQYPVYRDDYGWKIPSLPLRIAQQLKFPQPEAQRVLLNWRGRPFTYHSVSFSDVFADLTSKNKQRPADEFTGKIVIIGSTAPSLFDIKPTPLSRMHPGVEILATAIDNFKHGDYLRFPDARIAYLLLTLSIVWATAWGFYHSVGQDKFDRLFGASQFILLAVSYASINFTTTYINLTGPITLGLAYFTLARLYAFATGRALEKSTVRTSQERDGELHGVLMLISLGVKADTLSEGARETIRRQLEKTGSAAKSVEILNGRQKGIWNLFENTLAISWLRPADDEDNRLRILRDINTIVQVAGSLLQKHAATADNEVNWFVHEGSITGGEQASDSWRTLFAETLLRWKETEKRKS
ncbi:chase2 sensor protein [Sulfuricella denitrificans skB26]|uniref:Chase2 sensor protein n=1 Tax=Sulfuricella denitrificans (strain DSM 22764 / NBRC 105220 / skB26) TaxID=1163617 RepID=S6B6L4_SULDS|nr:CHASE2 domain-containing protein [Sulfuricella denitrificans]BAN36142.1 chase2 sensor protein [Sulfuricella denitrificans skB26]